MYFTRCTPTVNSNFGFLKLGVACALRVPDASDLDTAVVVVVEDVDHRFGAYNIDLSCATRDEFAIRREVAGVDLGDFDIFFENFHSVSTGGLPGELQVEVKQ